MTLQNASPSATLPQELLDIPLRHKQRRSAEIQLPPEYKDWAGHLVDTLNESQRPDASEDVVLARTFYATILPLLPVWCDEFVSQLLDYGVGPAATGLAFYMADILHNACLYLDFPVFPEVLAHFVVNVRDNLVDVGTLSRGRLRKLRTDNANGLFSPDDCFPTCPQGRQSIRETIELLIALHVSDEGPHPSDLSKMLSFAFNDVDKLRHCVPFDLLSAPCLVSALVMAVAGATCSALQNASSLIPSSRHRTRPVVRLHPAEEVALLSTDLKCPITLDFPFSPVICPNGKVYDRKAIIESLKTTKTDPTTRLPVLLADYRSLMPDSLRVYRAVIFGIGAPKVETFTSSAPSMTVGPMNGWIAVS